MEVLIYIWIFPGIYGRTVILRFAVFLNWLKIYIMENYDSLRHLNVLTHWQVLSIHSLQNHAAIFTKMLLNDALLDAVQQIIGSGNILLHHTKAHVKPPDKGSSFPMHQVPDSLGTLYRSLGVLRWLGSLWFSIIFQASENRWRCSLFLICLAFKWGILWGYLWGSFLR